MINRSVARPSAFDRRLSWFTQAEIIARFRDNFAVFEDHYASHLGNPKGGMIEGPGPARGSCKRGFPLLLRLAATPP